MHQPSVEAQPDVVAAGGRLTPDTECKLISHRDGKHNMLFRDTLLSCGLYHSIDIEKLLAYWTLVFQLCTEHMFVSWWSHEKTRIYTFHEILVV